MLTLEERLDVERELARAIAGSSRAICNVIFQNEGDTILLQIPMDASPEVMSSLVLSYCLERGWKRSPTLLDSLLTYLIHSKGIGRYQAYVGRIPVNQGPSASPYEAAWVRGGRPFFDRAVLRNLTKQLMEETNRPLLLVGRQADRFGRSHTLHFLEHLAVELPAETHVISEELSRGNGPSYQIVDLAASLAAQIGVAEEVPAQSGSSYPRQLCQWILKQIRARTGRWVIVLDGFGQAGVPDDVLDLIAKLALELRKVEYRLRARLVLLGYSNPIPQVAPADFFEEILPTASELKSEHLLPCVAAWNTRRGQEGLSTLPKDQVEGIAQRIADKAPQEGKERLEYFHLELASLLEYRGS